jgi:DNA-binding NarL/FixJ family response regulator
MQVARKVRDFFRQPAKVDDLVEMLSPREYDVLNLLATGLRYKEIGDKLDVSINTVRCYVMRIYQKLHVQSRTEATVKFLKQE